jgi:hypothetical protein
MKAKRNGTRNEHRSIRLLESAGYRCTRAAASLGAWDIIGISSTDVVLCQVKTRDWPGHTEMETLRLFPAPANAAARSAKRIGILAIAELDCLLSYCAIIAVTSRPWQ